jgi:hypothetical protein
MAADYYKSSQKYVCGGIVDDRLHWQLTRTQLDQNHKPDLDILLPNQYQLIRIFLYHCMSLVVSDGSGTSTWTQTELSTTSDSDGMCLRLPLLLQVPPHSHG